MPIISELVDRGRRKLPGLHETLSKKGKEKKQKRLLLPPPLTHMTSQSAACALPGCCFYLEPLCSSLSPTVEALSGAGQWAASLG